MNKVFRVKLYRRQSGPFECVVTAPSRKSAKLKAMLEAARVAKTVQITLAHELAPLPPSNTKEIAFNPDGTLKSKVVGKPCYPKEWTKGIKLAKPAKITRGGDVVISCEIKLIGKAA